MERTDAAANGGANYATGTVSRQRRAPRIKAHDPIAREGNSAGRPGVHVVLLRARNGVTWRFGEEAGVRSEPARSSSS
jgi:hypothetical protein